MSNIVAASELLVSNFCIENFFPIHAVERLNGLMCCFQFAIGILDDC